MGEPQGTSVRMVYILSKIMYSLSAPLNTSSSCSNLSSHNYIHRYTCTVVYKQYLKKIVVLCSCTVLAEISTVFSRVHKHSQVIGASCLTRSNKRIGEQGVTSLAVAKSKQRTNHRDKADVGYLTDLIQDILWK